jgi:hypothetical protein
LVSKMSDTKYQPNTSFPPGETKYQPGGYQPNTAYPPGVAHQGPPMVAVVVPQPQNDYKDFDKKKAKASSIILLVLGSITLIVTVFCLGPFGVLAFPIPIVAGILGVLSAKQPSNGKIVAFMVLSIISAIIAGIMILICVSITVGASLINSNLSHYDDSSVYSGIFIAGILSSILYVALTIVSIYCSVLCCKEVGCCGSKSHATGGVVHGQILQPGAPGVQYMHPQNPSSSGVQYMHPQNMPASGSQYMSPQNMQAPSGQYTSPQNMQAPSGQYMYPQNAPAQPPPYSQAIPQA